MSEGKEIIVAEHPKAWVVRMVEGRGLKVAEKTLYWWSVHLERFLKFCRSAGAESSEIPEVAARLFLASLPVGDSAQDFAREQARMALDVFIGEIVGWSWGEDRYGRVGPKFRLKANSTRLTTEDTGDTEGLLSTNQSESSDEASFLSEKGYSAPCEESVSEGCSALKTTEFGKGNGQNRESWEALRRALRVRHYALRAKRTTRLPVVLSREEVRRLLGGNRLDGNLPRRTRRSRSRK